MEPNLVILLAVILLPILVLGLLGIRIWKIRNSTNKRKRVVAILLSVYLISLFLVNLGYFFFSEYGIRRLFGILLVAPFQILVTTIPIILSFWIFKYINPALSGPDDHNIPNLGNPATLKEYVVKILDSNTFLTALRDTLPKGKDDETYGFDHIPYMLKSINERRLTFASRANRFLMATVFLGILLGGIVMYFGYILVNEAAAGTPRLLAEVHTQTRSIAEALNTLLPRFYSNKALQDSAGASLDRLEGVEPGEKNQALSGAVKKTIADAKRTGDVRQLFQTLSKATSDVSSDGEAEKQYSAILTKARDDLSRFMSTQDAVIPKLAASLEELDRLIPKANEKLETTENRVPEILKRLAVGLVVATFFLAILRYFSSLYTSHHQEELRAVHDDDLIRRFYIAYKSSAENEDQRTAVLTTFLSGTKPYDSNAKADSDGVINKQNLEIVKELFSALSKKL